MRKVLSAIAATIVVAATGTAAQAAPTLTDAQWRDQAQEAMTAFREASAADPGFAAVTLDVEARAIVIHRTTGAATAAYPTAVLPAGARLRFRSAPLAQHQTYELIDTIHQQRDSLAREGVDVRRVTSEWTGPVTVEVGELNPAAQQLPQRFSAFGPGTVKVVVQDSRDTEVKLGRDFDLPPFYAGAHASAAADFMLCTSGFGGHRRADGHDYMLIANHCVNPSDGRFWASNAKGTNGGRFIGTAVWRDAAHDMAYIRVAEHIGPRIWDGPITPKENQFSKRVVGVRHPEAGMQICTSGAFSGVRCYGTVIGGGWDGDEWLWWANSNDQSAIAAKGDSGGPLFQPSGDTVYAVGLMVESRDRYQLPASACTGEAKVCYNVIYFADVYTEAYINRGIDLTNSV